MLLTWLYGLMQSRGWLTPKEKVVKPETSEQIVVEQVQSDEPDVIEYKFQFNDDEVDLVYDPEHNGPKAETASDQLPWMVAGLALLGTKEIEDEDTIVGWADEVGVANVYNDSDIPWCGLFEGKIQVDAKCEIPDEPLWALNWRKFGFKLDEPAYGAVLVFKRDGGGHVGNYISEEDDYFHVLGGNQGNKVCIKRISKANLVAIRWPNEYKDRLKPGKILATLDEEIISSSQMV